MPADGDEFSRLIADLLLTGVYKILLPYDTSVCERLGLVGDFLNISEWRMNDDNNYNEINNNKNDNNYTNNHTMIGNVKYFEHTYL